MCQYSPYNLSVIVLEVLCYTLLFYSITFDSHSHFLLLSWHFFHCLSLTQIVFHLSHLCHSLFLSCLSPLHSTFFLPHLVWITCPRYSLFSFLVSIIFFPTALSRLFSFHLSFLPVCSLPIPFSLSLVHFMFYASLTPSSSFLSSPQLHRRRTTNLSSPWGPRLRWAGVKEGRSRRLTDRWYGTRHHPSPHQKRRWGRRPRPCPRT